jgi:hypothetical protein
MWDFSDRRYEVERAGCLAVFFNTPHSVIPYRFFDTGAVSNISLEIRRRNRMDSRYGVSLAVY